jgi:hypothetical protein
MHSKQNHGGLKLVKSPHPPPSRLLQTGKTIADSGLYRVYHHQHRVPHEVTLIKGEIFPRCQECDTAVRFKLLRAVPEIDSVKGFRVALYCLPVMNEVITPEEELKTNKPAA